MKQRHDSRYLYITWDKVHSLTTRASYTTSPTRVHKHSSTTTTYNVSHVHPCMSCVKTLELNIAKRISQTKAANDKM